MSVPTPSGSPALPAFEKLGLFYLGRRHDVATGQTLDEPVLYDSRDLVTHAVVTVSAAAFGYLVIIALRETLVAVLGRRDRKSVV